MATTTTTTSMHGDVEMDAPSNQDYVDGSLVRLRLHDFLTYADAEFFPGPRLNVLLGPNGSGKSSIVCALCVGLAGSTKLLGRADQVGQFVRAGTDNGYTEIELFFAQGNRVIRRQIFRDDTSVWTLDGRSVARPKIFKLLAVAHIQIGNLCQFLPQDKVGEFSHLDPAELLHATELAVLNGELATTHEQLMEMQRDAGETEEKVVAAQSALELKISENRSRKSEVDKVLRYEQVLEETELIEKRCLWLHVQELLAQVEELRAEKDACEDELQKARDAQVTPLEGLLETERHELVETTQKKSEMERIVREAVHKLKHEKRQIRALETAVDQIKARIADLRDQHKHTQAKLERVEAKQNKWHDERDAMPHEDQLQTRKTTLETTQRAMDTELIDVTSKREALGRCLYSINQDSRRTEFKLRCAQDETTQRQDALRKLDPDAIAMAEWVTRHRHQLQRNVWGPVALEIHVSEPLHAQYVEAAVPTWLLTAFIVECKDDYDQILSQKHKVSVLIVQDGDSTVSDRPFSVSEMASFRETHGICGYVDEFVTAPPVVHQALRSFCSLHRELVGTDATERLVNSDKSSDIFSVLCAEGDRVAAFVTPRKRYVTMISKYGSGNAITRTMDLRTPRLLAVSTVNETQIQQLTRELDDWKTRATALDAEIQTLESKERELTATRTRTSQQIHEIRTSLTARDRLQQKIAEAESTIARLRADLAQDHTHKETAMVHKLNAQAATQAAHFRECAALTSTIQIATAQLAVLELQAAILQVRVACVETHATRAETAIAALVEAAQEARQKAVEMAKRAIAATKHAEAMAPWESHEQAFDALSDDLKELRGVLENNKIILSTLHGDRNVLALYKRVCHEIQQDEAALDALRTTAVAQEDTVNAIKDAWHTQLRDVVQQMDTSFKDSFRQIGCVGEIALVAHDRDVSQWGIERRVQFRKQGKIVTMTAEAQSGGEKAVGTIMYLMAMQSLTQCPFRVVDEINQGMDEFNERKVFQLLTQAACGQKRPQYFVVSPKLIRGLQFHRDTTIHFVLNGPWNKLRQDEWDVRRALTAAQQPQQPPPATAPAPATSGNQSKSKRRRC